ncbi:MAG: hypothetical protein Kow00107_07070 [Planctomycetota bacterium]
MVWNHTSVFSAPLVLSSPFRLYNELTHEYTKPGYNFSMRHYITFAAILPIAVLIVLTSISPAYPDFVDDRLAAFKKNYTDDINAKKDAVKKLAPIDDPRLIEAIVIAYSDEPSRDTVDIDTVYRLADEALETVRSELVAAEMHKQLSHKHWRVRARLTRMLGVLAFPASRDVLLKLGKTEKDERVLVELSEALGRFKDASVVEFLQKTAMRPANTDIGMRAIVSLSDTGLPEGMKAIEEIMNANSAHEMIRAEALYWFCKNSPQQIRSVVTAALNDKSPAMQVMACDIIAHKKLDGFDSKLTELLSAPQWQLRVAATEACGELKVANASAKIIEAWKKAGNADRYGVAAHGALLKITGKSFGPRWEYWDNWHAANKDTPKAPAEKEGEYISYHGIQIRSNNICFVFDRSGSMRERVKNKSGYLGEGSMPLDETRMGHIKGELISSIRKLTNESKFNLVAFDHRLAPWKKEQVPASDSNKADAIRWVTGQEAKGWTNVFDSLMLGIGRLDDRKTGKMNWNNGPDTVVVLSDGWPSAGTYVDSGRFLWEVRRMNRLRRIVIHTVGIAEECDRLLEPLALENRGTFRKIAE